MSQDRDQAHAHSGLTRLLERIAADEPGALAERYLALVADLHNQSERAQWTLKLAHTLTSKNPDEAMRIAHMVYAADTYEDLNVRVHALDILIQIFNVKRRPEKVALLERERERLVVDHAQESMISRELLLAEDHQVPPFNHNLDLNHLSDAAHPYPLAEPRVVEMELAPERDSDFRAVELSLTGVELAAENPTPDAHSALDLLFPPDLSGSQDKTSFIPIADLVSLSAISSAEEENAQKHKNNDPAERPRSALSNMKRALGDLAKDSSYDPRATVYGGAEPAANGRVRAETSSRDVEAHPLIRSVDHFLRQGFLEDAKSALAKGRDLFHQENWWRKRVAYIESLENLSLSPLFAQRSSSLLNELASRLVLAKERSLQNLRERTTRDPDFCETLFNTVNVFVSQGRVGDGFEKRVSVIEFLSLELTQDDEGIVRRQKLMQALTSLGMTEADAVMTFRHARRLMVASLREKSEFKASLAERMTNVSLAASDDILLNCELALLFDKPRHALALIKDRLTRHPALDDVLILAFYADEVYLRLAWRPLTWRSSDGLDALQSELKSAPVAKLQSLIAV